MIRSTLGDAEIVILLLIFHETENVCFHFLQGATNSALFCEFSVAH